jgi:hypothetical protein
MLYIAKLRAGIHNRTLEMNGRGKVRSQSSLPPNGRLKTANRLYHFTAANYTFDNLRKAH